MNFPMEGLTTVWQHTCIYSETTSRKPAGVGPNFVEEWLERVRSSNDEQMGFDCWLAVTIVSWH